MTPLAAFVIGIVVGIPVAWALDWYHGKAYREDVRDHKHCPECGKKL